MSDRKDGWVERPDKIGLWWVYSHRRRSIVPASVFYEGERLMAATKVEDESVTVPVDYLVGSCLFFPTEVPPPPF